MSVHHPQFLQTDAVDELRRSRKVVGELVPVIWDDRRNEPISGAHRIKAGWKKIEHILTKDDLEFFRLKLHYSVQRQMPPAEVVAMLEDYGEALIGAGAEPGGKLMHAIVEMSPWDERYTYEMIPRRFKSDEGRPPGPSLRSPQTQTPLPDGFEPASDAPQQHLITCSRCGLRGTPVAGILREQ
jgi:hypothetical protein